MNIFLKKIIKNTAFLFGCAVFFISCDEDIAENNAKNKLKNVPTQVIYNAKIVQRDSGLVKLRASAKLLEKFELSDSPYVVARKGIVIDFYDKETPDKPGNIKANFAKYNEKSRFYEARGNVVIRTNKDQLFATQSVFWNQTKKEIYTSDTVFVTDPDGNTLVGANGMTAKDDFSSYQFFNNSGAFNKSKMSAPGIQKK
ncbi:LPS export ABC transporter periplasmic protein LptC [Frigoriflavimonas asaccharolytica]|uniref:LPS export ABC transporter protein LptC n=1 Tax=Frigoriflavimonas asaccharolytica TaxID=2735899 RepID=A0A8J8G9V8_9FLAO|nr:LPS export ABC transporter periplasmic protein LptC [Frigoriflavimonas asaccharolytica]NRS93290.1 LPS export ABC transporter protein LptC [Frigoriflavimonas asaccharolytica]